MYLEQMSWRTTRKIERSEVHFLIVAGQSPPSAAEVFSIFCGISISGRDHVVPAEQFI